MSIPGGTKVLLNVTQASHRMETQAAPLILAV